MIETLNKHAKKAVRESLVPGEEVEVIIAGPSAQVIIGTDRRVFVFKKGFMAGATLGSELTSFDYRNLNGVQLHTGMMSGAVVLQTPGQTGSRTSVWKQGDDDPYKAPNAIPINRPFDDARAGVAKLRQLIAEHYNASTSPAPSPQRPASVADEVRQLADLHTSGALSDQEFTALKAALVGRVQAGGL